MALLFLRDEPTVKHFCAQEGTMSTFSRYEVWNNLLKIFGLLKIFWKSKALDCVPGAESGMIYFVPRNNTQNFGKAGSSSAHLTTILEVRLFPKQFLSKTEEDIICRVCLMCSSYLKVSNHGLSQTSTEGGWFSHPKLCSKEGPDECLLEEPFFMGYKGDPWLAWTSSPNF